jgi:hypothetical protein
MAEQILLRGGGKVVPITAQLSQRLAAVVRANAKSVGGVSPLLRDVLYERFLAELIQEETQTFTIEALMSAPIDEWFTRAMGAVEIQDEAARIAEDLRERALTIEKMAAAFNEVTRMVRVESSVRLTMALGELASLERGGTDEAKAAKIIMEQTGRTVAEMRAFRKRLESLPIKLGEPKE